VTDFTLPELGENITSGDVLRVLVKPGDTIAKDQAVVELETDKATIEVPSSVAGKVKDIKVKEGDKVKVGQAILSVEDGAEAAGEAGGAGEAGTAEPKRGEAAGANTAAKVPADGGLEQHVEGEKRETPADKSGVKQTADRSAEDDEVAVAADAPPRAGRPTSTSIETEAPAGRPVPDTREHDGASVSASDSLEPLRGAYAPSNSAGGGVPGASSKGGAPRVPKKVVDISRGARAAAEAAAPEPPEQPPAPAAPSVRRMARELGVDITAVPGSGSGGRISTDDVKAYVNRLITGAARSGGGVAAEPLPDFSRWGEIERQPMRAVRRKTAEHLTAAWATVPHVTQCDVADVTELDELRKKYAKEVDKAGGNLTVTSIAIKIVAAALRRFPQFNASVDMGAGEVVYKKYVNIGVAVDTDRGLLVPVIRSADEKSITQLSVELAQLSEKARNRKISLEEMQGGCFSVSNLGGIGGTYFTPIVNAPEVAILGISRASMQPRYSEGQFTPRLMLPLSLSYDHRIIDGADGIRFLRWVCEALEQPFLLAL
jgi:pyruvate dehydrogenase E2 component (dihydrolipoamide acetyltransferase)